MDLYQNPFHILGAIPRDNRRRIMELADERSLALDSSACSESRAALTNPRKRLSAEVAWLPGVGSKRAAEIFSLLESSPKDLLAIGKLPPITRVNILTAGFLRASIQNADAVAEWILEISWTFERVDAEEVCRLINEERVVSGFAEESDVTAVESEIQNRRRYYLKVIKSALDNLSAKELVKAVTVAVESATNGGEEHGPILIADLVDSYEVEAQGFLDKEESHIRSLAERIKTAVDTAQPDARLAPMVNQLIQIVKNWDIIAQPIQVSAKSRGLNHEASHRVAALVRGLAIHMFNEHDKLELSQQLTRVLQEVFEEVDEIAERTAEDADALSEIAEQRQQRRLVSPISDQTFDNQPIQQPSLSHTIQESATQQQQIFPLLELTKWPSLPASWSSVDPGETWVWGDFFLTFQKNPKTFFDLAMEMQGKKAEYPGLIYHYAMSVFYRFDRNPHGPSHRPIMTIALEQADMDVAAKILGNALDKLVLIEGDSNMGPLMIGLFTGEMRLNLGKYEENVIPQAVKKRFFEILGRKLGVSGQPRMIGTLAQARGHPETGMPAQKQKTGCAVMILFFIGIGGLGSWALTVL